MIDEPLQQILDEARRRIQAELDGQVQALRAREAEAVEQARAAAEAETETRWAAKLESLRTEWAARLHSEVQATRAEAEKRLVAEAMRIRAEADQAIVVERERAAAEADRVQLESETREGGTIGAGQASVLFAIRAMDDGRSLSDVLASLARSAAEHAPRAALFVVDGGRLNEWPGQSRLSYHPIDLDQAGLLHSAVRRGVRVSSPGDTAEAPAFANLAAGRAAMAVPLMIGGQAAAVLYADQGSEQEAQERHGWGDALEVLARHAAACLAHLTAVRSLQLPQGSDGQRGGSAAGDEERGARRYAKLLVSEIKLYNEGAVRVGRERRDLLQRLKGEIERARRMYEERVSPAVSDRGAYFQQELVQTLAGGDAALLGS